jgi:pimeloyl-ACP methyl ester carboxylesterase
MVGAKSSARRAPHAALLSSRQLRLWLALLVCLPLCGACASPQWVRLRETPRNPLAEQLQLFASGGPQPTPRTTQLLRRYDLLDAWQDDPRALLTKLHEIAEREPSAEMVYAQAELAYLGAKRVELTQDQVALDLYGAAVTHAYTYLLDPRLRGQRNPYDPQYRGASDIYNAALESALRIVQKQGGLGAGQTRTIQTASRTIEMRIVLRGGEWKAGDFDRFEFVSDYEVEGLRNHYVTYGLGVPLIAVRKPHPRDDAAEQFYPPDLSVPMTAFLRVELPGAANGTGGQASPGNRQARAVLELHDSLATTEIEVAGRRVPLQSDATTPLAYFLAQPEFDDSRLSTFGLLHPGQARKLAGLYMLEPYQPDKIPVIMVHGLWSSPITWMEMFNDLRADPELRRHYQFWFYMYPTGQPFWFSATQMREDLAEARQILDPRHRHPALDQTVLVGHSMGGLVSKLQTLESGRDFWRLVSDQPFKRVKAEEGTREALAETFFFHPSPSIRRVITIATPHRGSNFANDATRWLGQKLIALPHKLLVSRQKLLRDNPGLFRHTELLEINTSIDSLAPESPILPVMLEVPTAPWVTYHNILGNLSGDTWLESFAGEGDGVVSVRSARLENAESELVVDADHSHVHRHPLAILEVRRILLEHLRQLRAAPPTRVVPAAATE